jgi:sugar phosphate isomerase/epimerase
MWDQLERLLNDLLPVAEDAGVMLCMHPDDPPLPSLLGKPRILHTVAAFERLVQLAPSPSNAICFCQGTFATMNADIRATIRLLGPHIQYVHFRDVRGTPESFAETFHDNGPTDMAEAGGWIHGSDPARPRAAVGGRGRRRAGLHDAWPAVRLWLHPRTAARDGASGERLTAAFEMAAAPSRRFSPVQKNGRGLQ